MGYTRHIVEQLLQGLERLELIQIVVGPRQVGKTTAARQVAERWRGKVHHAAADLPLPPGPEWIEAQWNAARALGERVLLVLDEVQKVMGWSEVVKALWDEDRARGSDLRVLVLGSSSLLIARGAGESLAGRFFLHRCHHWAFPECAEAFGWDMERWIYFGGYPGAVGLTVDEHAWRAYVADSLVETVLARDVLALQSVNKPALLRQLFMLATRFPARILSYTKMLGQLQDAGNTTTLAHYLRLLETAFLASGLERYSAGQARRRGSSPKLVVWNNALVSAMNPSSFEQARADHAWWGRLVENAVGAHLLAHLQSMPYEVTYWRHRHSEIDYVVNAGNVTWAIEVKSARSARGGLAAFSRRFPTARSLIVGTGGMPLEEFFTTDPKRILV